MYAPLVAAAGASVTLVDSNCDSFVLSGPPGNQTLACVVSTAPVCTISPADAHGQVNTPVNLTANCTGAANDWTWGGGNCAGLKTQTCPANSQTAATVVYTVIGTNTQNNFGPSPLASTTVIWSNSPPPAPTGCQLGANPSSLGVGGGPVVLTATCTGGGTPTSYSWTGGLPTPTTTNQQSVTVTATTTFSVTPSNGGTAGNTASVQVLVATPGGGGPIAACSGFTSTKVIDAAVPANGGLQFRYFTTDGKVFSNGAAAGFGAGDAIVVRFKAPAEDPFFNISMYETGTGETGAQAYRTMVLSTKSCDFGVPKSADAVWSLEDTGFSQAHASGRTSEWAPYILTPGVTYYLNVKNYAFGNTPTCSASRCDVFFVFSNPSP
jgi:hypothetical protein